MSTYYRDTRSSYRDRRDSTSSSDDNVRSSTTVHRYKVTPSRVDREDDYERRSARYSNHGRNSSDFLEVDRYKERSYEDSGRPKSAVGDKGRITVWEDKDWDKRSRNRHHDDDMRVEKRFEERFDDSHGHEVERYRKETEYYTQADPAPAPVVIRQRAPEPQRIYVQEAPPPAPIIVPRQDPNVIVLRDRDTGRQMVRRRSSYDEDYYYRHEKRDGPHRNYEVTKWDRRRRDDGGYSSDDDYYVKKTVIRRERSESPHHKRRLAEGALAGAGITALLSSRRNANGDVQDHRGRKVLAGAALGALGTEAVRRAHSAYEDRFGDRDESPDHHHRLKKGLGIAAVALAAAGAAKYLDTNKAEKEEAARGRSRRRGYSRSSSYSGSRSYSRSASRPRSKKRSLSRIGKAALGTAAALGVAKKLHDRSKSRGSRSRSKSKIRRAAELGAGAAAVGLGAKAWKNHREKKKERERSRGLSEDESDYRGASRSRSRSRSQARSLHSDAGADRELGLVEYGDDPLVPEQPSYPDERAYESEAEARRERRRRRRDRDRSASETDDGGRGDRKRSKSRLRDMAAAGAAAIGIKEYKDKKDAERKSRERRSRERDQDSRRRRDDRPDDGYFDNQGHPPSPPNASGGAYYPPYPQTPGGSGTFQQQPNAPPNGEYPPYVPQDYTGYPPPPPGPPPMSGANGSGYQPPQPPPGPPPMGGNPPDHVSEPLNEPRGGEDGIIELPAANGIGTAPATNKSVSFIPLSPKSAKTMKIHRQSSRDRGRHSSEESSGDDKGPWTGTHPPQPLQLRPRRSSDPTADRSVTLSPANSDDVENLPDRFDRHGRPLDPRGRLTTPHGGGGVGGMTTRSGEFERQPRKPGDWSVRGAWQVSSTDQEAVDRVVRNVTGALEGRGGWMNMLGDVFGGGLLGQRVGGGAEEGAGQDQGSGGRQRNRESRRRRRGSSDEESDGAGETNSDGWRKEANKRRRRRGMERES